MQTQLSRRGTSIVVDQHFRAREGVVEKRLLIVRENAWRAL
jgi:hypothetical protein